MTTSLHLPPLRAELDAALTAYLARHPDEAPRLAALTAQLAEDGNPFARSNMRGHVTVSALVLNATRAQVLLVHHLALDRWLQPGGHVKNDASLWTAACREVREETGVSDLRPLEG